MTTEAEHNDQDGVVVAKIIAGSCLFLISVLCGVIPFKLAQIFKWSEPLDPSSKSEKKSSKFVAVLLSFGGGVLLATTFLHLLPDISGEIDVLKKAGSIPEWNISLPELLMMMGFFLIYLIEEIVHYYLHRYQEKLKKSQSSVATMDPEEESFAEAFMRGISARNSVHRRFSDGYSLSRRGSTLDISDSKALSVVNEKGQMEMSANDRNHTHNHNNNHHNHNNHNHHTHDNHDERNNHGHSHAIPMPHTGDEDLLVSSLRGLLIVLALSIHELFEGFAVGLERNATGVYYLFFAVCAHKFVISFCIGVELMVQRTKIWLAFLYVFVYSFVSAFGILIGAVLTTGELGKTLEVPNVILQGFATGTLLYVIFFEVLSKDRSGLLPYLSVFSGFLLMLGLQFIAAMTENKGTGAKNAIIDETTLSSLIGAHKHG